MDLHGLMLERDIVVRKFELQSRRNVYFRTYTLQKGVNPLLPSNRLNSSTTFLLQGYLKH